ncbi:hypothetical protein EGM70_07490 [Enterobacteriaceae bacterium 89]|nr:hypothetical protein [Enterobacteriaceae bacterium 89]
MQFALGYVNSWQSSFFRFVGLGYYVDHSAARLQLSGSSEFLPTRYPLLGFDFILPATCIQKDIALD